jgi:HK97 family phage major capsid protein
MWSVPLGKPLEMKPDKRGLYTVTRFDPGPENDRILTAIQSQSLRGMSYTGVFVQSDPERSGYSQYKPDRNGELPLVTRKEIALIEYGPTPIPAFVTAEIVGVRARELAAMVRGGYSAEAAEAMVRDGFGSEPAAREVIELNGSSRTGVPVHHTDVSTTDYHAETEVGKMKFPTSWDHMQSVYALADQAAGADSGNKYLPEHGHLPHHHVGDDGNPGPANLIACRNALLKADTIEGFPTDSKQKAKAHLRAHIEDAGASTQADNKTYPAVVTGAAGMTSNSGRTGQEETERATAAPVADDMASPAPERDTTVATHGPHTGAHSHNHNAYDGPDDNSDGMHGHEHEHEGDAMHDHDHEPGTSGRAGKKKKKGKSPEPDADDMGMPTGVAAAKAGKFDPDKDGDDDSKAATDKDHDYWTADGKQKKPVPGKPMKDSKGGRDDGPAEGSQRADGVDTSPWDAGKVWAKGSAANDPAKFFASVCAGRRNGDSKLQATWALPHHYSPGDPPNAAGVSAALGRLRNTQGLVNSTAAKAHLEAHERAIQAAKSGTKGSSSSGRNPAAAVPRNADASTGSAAATPGPQPHPANTSTTNRSNTMADLMSIDQRQARLAEVQHRLQEIDAENMGAELPDDTRTEWSALQQELVIHQRAIKDATARSEYLRTILENPELQGFTEGTGNGGIGYGNGDGNVPAAYGGPGSRTAPTYRQTNGNGTPAFYNPMRSEQVFDLTAIRQRAHNFDEVPVLMREHAMRAIEMVRYAGPKSREDCQTTVANLLDRVDDEQGTLARRVLTTGSPIYDRAFGKMLGKLSVNGLSTEESRALQLGVDSAGGFAVPFQLDPTVILSSNGAINPLRQISRVEQITGKEWDGVTSAGVVVNRVAEGTEAATGDPLLVQPNVRTTRVQGFVPFNIELDVSWGALRSQMTNLLMDAKDIEEATSFALGNGTAPNANGVITTLHDQSAGSLVNTAGTATLAIGDLYNLENNMAPRFRQQSAYLASKTTFNRFRQLFQALASAAFDSWVRPSAGTPATFNGYPAYELSTMTTSIASGSLVLLQGDFSQFLIVDRIGMGIELIPHLFGATNRFPVGQRGILAIWFNNSRVLVPNAFRLLQTL